MFCPKCRGEFQDTVTRCEHCKVDLVAERPGEDLFSSPDAMAAALKGKELEAFMVGSYVDLAEAQKRLAEQRIPTVMVGEENQEIEASMHARIYLATEASRIPEVRELLEKPWKEGAPVGGLMLHKELALEAGTCPACNTAVPPEASECPECGLFLGDPDAQE